MSKSPTYSVIRNTKIAKAQKDNSAKSHFDIFLKNSTEIDADSFDELTVKLIDEELFGKLATYFAEHASSRKRKDIAGQLIGKNTAVQYFSACKNLVLDKKFYWTNTDGIKIRYEFPFLNPGSKQCQRWTALIMSKKNTQAVLSGVPSTKGHQSATPCDAKATFWLCAWLGDVKDAEFLLFSLTTFHLMARSSEISLIKQSSVTTTDLPEIGRTFAFYLNRVKTEVEQGNLHVFPHSTKIELCLLFAYGFYLTLADDENEYLFPEYAKLTLELARNKKDSKRYESSCSRLFNTNFRKLVHHVKTLLEKDNLPSDMRILLEEFNKFLSSHSGKKFGINHANMANQLASAWICHRAGLAVQGIHTFFDYVQKQLVHDIKVAKHLAGWPVDGMGGIAPTFEGAVEQSIALRFVNNLFKNSTLSDSMKLLLGANLLRFLRDYENIMKSNLFEAVGNPKKFITRLQVAANDTGYSLEDVRKWGSVIHRNFVQRNMHTIPWETVVATGMSSSDTFSINPRPINEQLTTIKDAIKRNTCTLSNSVANLRSDVAILKSDVGEIKDKLNVLLELVKKNGISSNISEKECTTTAASIAEFPTSLKKESIDSLLYKWYVYAWDTLYTRKKASSRTLDPRIASDVKIVIEYSHLFLKREISVPQGSRTSVDAKPWRDGLKKTAQQIQEDIQRFFETHIPNRKRRMGVSSCLKDFRNIDIKQYPQGPVYSIKPVFRTKDDLLKQYSKQYSN